MKKGKKIAGVLLVVAVTSVLTGCVDNMPELTDEQSQLIAEYAADLLLQYSPNYHTKLVDIEETAEEETTEETTEEMTNVSETQETSEETAEESTLEIVEPEVQPQEVDFAQIVGLSDFSLKYDTYETSDSYPQDATGYRIDAAEDKTLLIVHFILTNELQEDVECSFFERNLSFTVTIDGKKIKSMSSMLDNDMTTYINTITAGAQEDLVVIFEISREQADSKDMILQIGTTDITME